MKKAILKLIDRKIEFYKTGFTVIHLNEISLLQDLRSEIEKMNEWIPVIQKPNEYDTCLILMSLSEMKTAIWIKDLEGEHFEDNDGNIFPDVTHWMLLPNHPTI